MDQQTIDTYNAMAKDYDNETIEFWEQFPMAYFDKFIALSGQKILNVGSGPGRDGLILQKSGKDVLCIDASEAMVALSREKGLHSVVGDFNKLPFKDSAFDGVWAYTSLLHVSKSAIYTPLGEIKRVLKPGGWFALGLIEGGAEEYKLSSGMNKSRLFSFYKKEEVEELCSRHGFQLEYFDTYKPRSKNYLHFIFQKI